MGEPILSQVFEINKSYLFKKINKIDAYCSTKKGHCRIIFNFEGFNFMFSREFSY